MECVQGERCLLSVIISLYYGLCNILTNFHELKKSTKKGPPDLFVVCLATEKVRHFCTLTNWRTFLHLYLWVGTKAPTMMPTDCSVLCTPTILPIIRISWDCHPTFRLILGRIPRSFIHLWASSCGFRPFDPGILYIILCKIHRSKYKIEHTKNTPKRFLFQTCLSFQVNVYFI